jgi:hypothetical protein
MKTSSSFLVAAALFTVLALTFNSTAQIATFDQRVSDSELAQKLRQMTDRSGSGLVPVLQPDGSMMVDLQGRFKYAMLGQIGAHGQPIAGCVSSVKEANAFYGRNLETGEELATRSVDLSSPVFDAGRHGMSEGEFEFYKDLIKAYQDRITASPESANFVIVNEDGPGEGFNDTTVAVPVGGNTGVTLGAQRLNVFQAAAAIWGAFLDSTVTIEVGASFDPLPCSQFSGVLGAASTTTLHGNFANAPFQNTWHHQALANKISGGDRSPANPDLSATFNSSINGNSSCLNGQTFYLGLDNSNPGNTNNLLIVLLHEFAHGLGFADFIDTETGALFNGFPDIYTKFVFDRTTSKVWADMSNAERVASAINNNNVVWNGKSVGIGSGSQTSGRDPLGRIELFTPNPVDPGSSIAHWNTRAFPNLLMEPFITPGLPLNLDMTRQFMRDVGWFRDSDGNGTPDGIGNVTPSGGFALIGTQATVNWTRTGGFNQSVAVELSTDGGVTYPTVLVASTSGNTINFTVPNTPTTDARIRVREVGYANPSGESSQAFTISATPPTTDRAPLFDIDGDGKTDISIFRPNGVTTSEWWFIRSSDSSAGAAAFGTNTDVMVPADYTGDGKTDLAFWRPSTGEWFIARSGSTTFFGFPFGTAGDVPMPADFDGDGQADAAVFRPSTNTWFIQRSGDGNTTIAQFGLAGDKPIAADYDGDGKADIAIFRPSNGSWWYSRSSDGSVRAFSFGVATDRPVPADYTGDGKADVAVWRPSTGEWFVQRSDDNTYYALPFGLPTDVPIPGDYDGDGKTDVAVFRPANSTWYILGSTAGFFAVGFGQPGDAPLPSAYVR